MLAKDNSIVPDSVPRLSLQVLNFPRNSDDHGKCSTKPRFRERRGNRNRKGAGGTQRCGMNAFLLNSGERASFYISPLDYFSRPATFTSAVTMEYVLYGRHKPRLRPRVPAYQQVATKLKLQHPHCVIHLAVVTTLHQVHSPQQ